MGTQPVAPVGQAHGVGALGAEHATTPGAALGGEMLRVVTGVTRTSRPGGLEGGEGEVEPRAGAAAGDVLHALERGARRSSSSARRRCPVNVGQPIWSATTCSSSRSAPRRQHRVDEVRCRRGRTARRCGRSRARRRTRRPGAPRRASCGRRRRAGRPGRSRPSPRRAWTRRRRRSRSRRGRGTRRRSRRRGQVAGAVGVDRVGRVLGGLGAVDVGPRGAVDDDLGLRSAAIARATASASVRSRSSRPRASTSWPRARAACGHGLAEHPASAVRRGRLTGSRCPSCRRRGSGTRAAGAPPRARCARCGRAARTPCGPRGRSRRSRRAGSSARPPRAR